MTAAGRPSVTDNARAEAERRYGTPRESDLLPSDYVTIGQIEGYVEGRRAAGRAETTTATTEDAARVINEVLGGGMDNHARIAAHRLADAGLLATARTRPTETEWGVRWRPDDYEAAPDEDTARLWAASDTGHPVALVRREVTAWTEADQ